MKFKKFCLVLGILFMALLSHAQVNYKTLIKNFQIITGKWEGTLTYLDYSSGKPYTIPADIEISRIKKTNRFVCANIYPNETRANSIDTITISKDGKYIEKQLVKSKRQLPGGAIEIITEESGKDGNDNKPAIFRHTYFFNKKTFKKRKDVQFTGETKWINRHEYTYTRKL